MKSYLFCALVLMLPTASFAFGLDIFDSKLRLYRCPSANNAMSCTQCEAFTSKNYTINKIDFKIDSKGLILFNHYQDEKLIDVNKVEGCSIIDKNNWSCGNDGEYDQLNNFSKIKRGMVNGVFYSVAEFRRVGIAKFNIAPSSSESYTCAK